MVDPTDTPSEPPHGLSDAQRAAWEVLAAGGSYKAAAEAAERSTGTVSSWVQTWRARHGADLFNRVHSAGPSVVRAMWESTRAATAANVGQLSGDIADLIRDTLPHLTPATLTVADLQGLAKILDTLTARADTLVGASPSTPPAAGSNLDGLEDMAKEEQLASVREIADAVKERRARSAALREAASGG